MTFGFILWGEAWQSTPFALNIFKCTLASLVFFLVYAGSNGASQASAHEQGMILLSSFIGIIIGDNTWLAALQIIGAKQVIVIDTLKPFLAAILGSLLLNEAFTWNIAVGILISSAGILMVSLDKETRKHHQSDPEDNQVAAANKRNSQLMYGYFLAAINVILDAFGSVITKMYGTRMSTWEINLLRFGFAAVVMGFCCIFVNAYVFYSASRSVESEYKVVEMTLSPIFAANDIEKPSNLTSSSTQMSENSPSSASVDTATAWYVFPQSGDMTAAQWGSVCLGIMFVTFLCPALSNYSLFQIPLGLCLTLTSLGPLYSVPLVWLMTGERTGYLGMAGVVFAVLGLVLMTSI
eukprot:gene24846-30022_t